MKTTYGRGEDSALGSLSERLRSDAAQGKYQVLGAVAFSDAAWRENPQALLLAIRERFGTRRVRVYVECDRNLSLPPVASRRQPGTDDAVSAAINAALEAAAGRSHVRVCVKPIIDNVRTVGYVRTYDTTYGAPYYFTGYDDRITAGMPVTYTTHRAAVIRRDASAASLEKSHLTEVVHLTQELERMCHADQGLDVEYATAPTDKFFLLDVQRVSLRSAWNRHTQLRFDEVLANIHILLQARSGARKGMAGSSNVLVQMMEPDSIAMLGTHPRPLALSLYRNLMTDRTWYDARASMGYFAVGDEVLTVSLAGRPYVDGRSAFNACVPATLDKAVREKVVEAWLTRLRQHPELHGQVRDGVTQTLVDFSFEQDFRERYGGTLPLTKYKEYRDRLRRLTEQNLSMADSSSLRTAAAAMRQLESHQEMRVPLQLKELATLTDDGCGLLWAIQALLTECRSQGAHPYLVADQHAHIAGSLLRSAIVRGALEPDRYQEFAPSLATASKRMGDAYDQVVEDVLDSETFLVQFGHVRASAFDIRSPRQDQRDELFRGAKGRPRRTLPRPFVLSSAEEHDFTALLQEAHMSRIKPKHLLQYAKAALVARDACRFAAMRDLSDILELIALWAERFGLSRDDASYLTVDEILLPLRSASPVAWKSRLKESVDRRMRERELSKAVRLGPVIRDECDLEVVWLHASTPAFVTQQIVEGPTLALGLDLTADVTDKIVCVENADVGYDWLVTRAVRGIITKFGDSSSPLAMRCAARSVPAAIGVGEQPFERLVYAGRVRLNCRDGLLQPM